MLEKHKDIDDLATCQGCGYHVCSCPVAPKAEAFYPPAPGPECPCVFCRVRFKQ